MKRMPLLTIDEVLLLVDAYFQLKDIQTPSVKREMIQELSDNMRKLPLFPELVDNPAFRSVSGMNMCLANVGYLDPDNPSEFGHGSALQKRIFSYYFNRRTNLRRLVIAINSIATAEFQILPEYHDFIGGAMLPSYHCYIEKTDKTVLQVRNNAISDLKTSCGLCGDDLFVKYGEAASSLLEPHIRMHLSELRAVMSISSSDVVMLCPNCHRWMHLAPENYVKIKLSKSEER